MQEQAWEEAPKASELTLKELTETCQKYADLRLMIDELEAQSKKINEEMKAVEGKILEYLKEYGMPNFKGAFGTISIRNTKTISQPETMEEKLKFFDYLKEQNLFESMVSVNSRTLSSWATKEIESREKEGVYGWVPPGLKPAQEFQKITLKRA